MLPRDTSGAPSPAPTSDTEPHSGQIAHHERTTADADPVARWERVKALGIDRRRKIAALMRAGDALAAHVRSLEREVVRLTAGPKA